MSKIDKKTLIIRAVALLIVIMIAAAMFVIGRGHTIYFDNKSFEAGGETIETPYSIEVYVKGEKVAKLKAGERGKADIMGQSLAMQLVVTQEKGGASTKMNVKLPIPYNMDGVIINIPVMLAGKTPADYMTEFIPAPPSDDDEDVSVTEDAGELMEFEQ